MFPFWYHLRRGLIREHLAPYMRIVALRTLREFWEQHADSEVPLRAWYHEAKHADWDSPARVKTTYGSASVIANSRVVFNIKGNSYRLVVKIHYTLRIIYIRFVGTHAAYDRIHAEEV
jgi:mRNA interferase HigB